MRGRNQKIKLLYLARIMQEKTDQTHYLTMPEIIEELAAYDITANRRSIYDDIQALNHFGITIKKFQDGPKTYYHCVNRTFELAELHAIVDAISSSKFITTHQSKKLIEKLGHDVSRYDAKLLERDFLVSGRIKNMNESVFNTIDTIQNAITNNHRIGFQYFGWNTDKEMELHHEGKIYDISPWMPVWLNENYYLIGYDAEVDDFRYYRVDKMLNTIETTEKRKGAAKYKKLDKSVYTRMRFNMFDGQEQTVTLRCDDNMANVIIDQFGRDIKINKTNKGYFTVVVDVAVSDQFYGWIFGLGGKVIIESPEDVKKGMLRMFEDQRNAFN